MQQMLQQLLAMQEKEETNMKADLAKMKANREKIQAEMEAMRDKRMDPGKMQIQEEHQEFPKENSVVKPVKGRKKRHRDGKPAAGRRGEPNDLTRGDCGSEKLAAACKKITCCATVAWRKRNVLRKIVTQGNCEPRSTLTAARIMMTRHARMAWHKEKFVRKDCTTDNAEQETPKRLNDGKILRKGLVCNNGIRDQGLREQLRGRMRISDQCGRQPPYLRKEKTTTNGIKWCNAGQRSHLGSEGTINKKLYEIFRGRIAKQIVGTPSGLRKIRKWTLWRGRPPPKWKRKLQIQEEQDNVGSPATP
jgi:hypothetical protein